MCSGKTRVGRELASLLKLDHVDIDRLIEAKVGPLLPFFNEKGEEEFRRIESATLTDLLKKKDVIVSTGGGTPLSSGAMDRMLNGGTVIWLDVPMDALMPRIERAGGDRPLLFGLKGNALHKKVNDLLAQRTPIYARAHFKIDAADRPDLVAIRIKQLLDLQAR